jgi:predicted RNA binding protein YcfA (HicA-like mRNA interferase family)
MAVLDAKKTYKNLLKKGFVDAPNRSDDHKYLELYHNDMLVLYTKISHGEKDLGDHLIKQMYAQCKLDKTQFLDLARCPMSQDAYFEMLRDGGWIE